MRFPRCLLPLRSWKEPAVQAQLYAYITYNNYLSLTINVTAGRNTLPSQLRYRLLTSFVVILTNASLQEEFLLTFARLLIQLTIQCNWLNYEPMKLVSLSLLGSLFVKSIASDLLGKCLFRTMWYTFWFATRIDSWPFVIRDFRQWPPRYELTMQYTHVRRWYSGFFYASKEVCEVERVLNRELAYFH